MLNFNLPEMLVLAVVAIVVIGPKDLPRAMRSIAGFVTKVKRVAGEFQNQVNDAMRESELDDVRKQVEDIGRMDPLKGVKRDLEPANRIGADIQRELAKPANSVSTAAAALTAAAPAAVAHAATPAAGVETVAAVTTAAPASVAASNAQAAKSDWDRLSETERAMIDYNSMDLTTGWVPEYTPPPPPPTPAPAPVQAAAVEGEPMVVAQEAAPAETEVVEATPPPAPAPVEEEDTTYKWRQSVRRAAPSTVPPISPAAVEPPAQAQVVAGE